MSGTAPAPRVALAPARRRGLLDAARPWLLAVLLAVILPWLFRDWAHARDNGFMISMLGQIGMMIIFALSYNMLLGEAGLLSFGHAVFFGFGGYCVAHALNNAGSGSLSLPLEVL
ncbi:MAG: branched-chain amino acid ABC transporter permease, partial [Alphaproteobacteria bacterium]|nr:branched-chain amino acid ABC transporter permease [Alphaproteobacteria bacterium]